MKNKNQPNSIGLFEIISLIVVILSSISIFLLTMNRFSPYLAMSLSAISLLFIFLKYHNSFSLEKIWTKSNAALLLILLLAVAFRYQPYLHTYGGIEDQGVYVLMSEMYAKTGSTFIHDEVRSKINDSILINQYDSQNQLGEHHSWGIHIKDLNKSAYVFRFYPLHSLWMSLFSAIFGSENRVYSLLFFSLISIIAVFLIVYELFDRRLAPAIIASAIIAVNPLHVYLSKIPVSEITVIAFASSGLYFLLKWYKQSESDPPMANNLHLLLSAMLFGCLFFTRITAFVYLPFLYFLTVIAILYFPYHKIKKNLIMYFVSVYALYALSLLYAHHYTPHYLKDIVISVALPWLLGDDWRTLLPYIISFLIIFCVVLWSAEGKQVRFLNKPKDFLREKRKYFLLPTVLLAVALIAHSTYQKDFRSIYALMEYLSFPLFLVIFAAIYHYSKGRIEYFSLIILLMTFFLVYLPRYYDTYQFYPRYLAEPIFFSLLLSVIFLLDIIKRSKTLEVLGYALLIFVFLSFAYFSSYQWRESPESLHTALAQIKQQISDKDLLIIDRDDFRYFFEMKSSLDYFEGVNTFGVGKIENIDYERFSEYFTNYRNVYVLSERDKLQEVNITQITTPEIELILKTPYAQTIARGPNDKLPLEHIKVEGNLYLYKLN